MSWYVHLEIDAGGAEPMRIGDLDANYTWNVNPMFALAWGDGYDGLNDWDGISAEEAARRFKIILAAFEADPDRFLVLNPANGWGNFEGAKNFIQTIHDACEAAPRAVLRVW